jgi:hypothetical protein
MYRTLPLTGLDDSVLLVEDDVRFFGPRTDNDLACPHQPDLTGPKATPNGVVWDGVAHAGLLAGR